MREIDHFSTLEVMGDPEVRVAANLTSVSVDSANSRPAPAFRSVVAHKKGPTQSIKVSLLRGFVCGD